MDTWAGQGEAGAVMRSEQAGVLARLLELSRAAVRVLGERTGDAEVRERHTGELLAPLHHAALVLGLQDRLQSSHLSHHDKSMSIRDGTDHVGPLRVMGAPPGTAAACDAQRSSEVLDLSYVKPLPQLAEFEGVLAGSGGVQPAHSLLAAAAETGSQGLAKELAGSLGEQSLQAARQWVAQVMAQDELSSSGSNSSSSSSSGVVSVSALVGKAEQEGVQEGEEVNAIAGCTLSSTRRGARLWRLEALESLGLACEELVPAAHGTLVVDVALLDATSRTAKVALLLEGPWAHSRSVPHTPLGQTLLARRLLVEDGWRVVPLAWYEWCSMHTEEDQLAYVCSALAAASVQF